MVKLNYVEGDYKEVLNIYVWVGLDDLLLIVVLFYRLWVIVEVYVIKGFCLEKLFIFFFISNFYVDWE